MMLDEYIALDGSEASFDIDDVVRVVKGHSQLKQGWKSLVVYYAANQSFIELQGQLG